MGNTNYGNQVVSFKYKEDLKASSFTKFLNNVIPFGIHRGGTLTTSNPGSTADVSVASFDAVFKASDTQMVSVYMPDAVNISTVSPLSLGNIPTGTPYVLMSYKYDDVIANYVDFEFSAGLTGIGNAKGYIVLGKAIFTGSNVLYFDYSEATYPPTYTPSTGVYTIKSELAVNGGTLSTDDTTFNLIDATATTVNFAGAATTVNMMANNVGGVLNINTTKDATNYTTAGVVVDSGIGVAKKIISNSTVQGTQLISSIPSGTIPVSVTSPTVCTNLNADMLDGLHYNQFTRSDFGGQTYLAGTTTLSVPAGATWFYYILCGGGGGGGGSNYDSASTDSKWGVGAGGGSGMITAGLGMVANLSGTTITVGIGSGGGASGTSGTAGTASILDCYNKVSGGGGGGGGTPIASGIYPAHILNAAVAGGGNANGGVGVLYTTGSVNRIGGGGGGGGLNGGDGAIGGNGTAGTAGLTPGGAGGAGASGAVGGNAVANGGGGGAGGGLAANVEKAGGNGANGFIQVWFF